MGLFDTIHLSEPLHLAGCDQPVTEIQTKEFGNTMRDYFIGSVLDQSSVLTGVVGKDPFGAKLAGQGAKGSCIPFILRSGTGSSRGSTSIRPRPRSG